MTSMFENGDEYSVTSLDQFCLGTTDIENVSVCVLSVFVKRARLRYGTRNEIERKGENRLSLN